MFPRGPRLSKGTLFFREIERVSPDEVRACIRSRLLSDITNGKSSGVERGCELVGKDKEVDMFVRSGDIQVGIFAGLTDPATMKILDDIVDSLPEDDNEPKEITAHGESQEK